MHPYLARRASAFQTALLRWRTGWPEDLLDYEPFHASPSLYQGRAEAVWYLCGILSLPHVIIAPRQASTSNPTPWLSVHEIFERLLLLSDQRRLDTQPPDFEAKYQLVFEIRADCYKKAALGALVYQDLDPTRPGFED